MKRLLWFLVLLAGIVIGWFGYHYVKVGELNIEMDALKQGADVAMHSVNKIKAALIEVRAKNDKLKAERDEIEGKLKSVETEYGSRLDEIQKKLIASRKEFSNGMREISEAYNLVVSKMIALQRRQMSFHDYFASSVFKGWPVEAKWEKLCSGTKNDITAAIQAVDRLSGLLGTIINSRPDPSLEENKRFFDHLKGMLLHLKESAVALDSSLAKEEGKVDSRMPRKFCKIQAHKDDVVFCKITGEWVIKPRVMRRTLFAGDIVEAEEVRCKASTGVASKNGWGSLRMKIGGMLLGAANTFGKPRAIIAPVDGAIALEIFDDHPEDNLGTCDYVIIIFRSKPIEIIDDGIRDCCSYFEQGEASKK